MRVWKASAVLGVIALLALGTQASAATTVTNTFMPEGWTFTSEGSGTQEGVGWFDAGLPGAPTSVGDGGAHFALADGTDGVVLTRAIRTSSTPLGQTTLGSVPAINYRTYRSSEDGGNNLAVALQFEFDYDVTAAGPYQGRIVYEPYQQPGVGGTVLQNQYRSWYPGSTSLWWLTRKVDGTSNAGGPCSQSTPCTFAGILALYPNAGLAEFDLGGTFAADVAYLKAGSGWPGFEGYVDLFTYGTDTWNFEGDLGACRIEPTDIVTKTIRLRDDCSTSRTLSIEGGYTLDGQGHSITAYDPAGGHFLGPIVTNGGASAHVTDVEVTSYRLDDVCDSGADRLRGVLFDGASGSITDVHVHGVRQGLSGCQEGNAIEVRNVDASAGTQMAVAISGNTISDYQKNGITANGNVAATINDNTITGDGQITYIAQNGIQVGFGATAIIRGNEVSGNWYTPESYEACGLLFFEANGVKKPANTLFDNEKDLCNAGRGGGNFEPS